MKTKTLIEGMLSEKHEKFLRHCKEINKTFVEELDDKDFVDYRPKYLVPTEEIWFFAKKLNFRSDNLHFDDKLHAFVFEDDFNLNDDGRRPF